MRRLASSEEYAPPSKRRRVFRRPSFVPRLLARLSDLYIFPVASLQSSGKLLNGDSSPTLLSPLPVFDSSEPAQVSSPLTIMRETPLALLPRSSSGSNSRPCPTLLGLPVELRNLIYRETLGPPITIHTVHPQIAPADYFLFLRCSTPIGESGECTGCKYLATKDLKSDHGVFDMSLLLVSQEVRNEASAILFSRNHFWFPTRFELHNFGKAFPNHAKHMQMVSFTDVQHESYLEQSINIFQYYARRMRKDFLTVKALTIYVQVVGARNTNRPFFEESILNYFRPLSRLPLSQAHVKLTVNYGVDPRIPQEMLRVLSAKAEGILLLDASLPEQEMQMRPQDANPDPGPDATPRIRGSKGLLTLRGA